MNLLSIAIDGNTLGMFLLGLLAALVISINLLRYYFSQKAKKNLLKNENNSNPPLLSERNKYLSIDVFKFSGTFFNIGMTVALGVSVLAFSWTKFEPLQQFQSSVWEGDSDNIETIRTPAEKPKPLPPPPPKPKIEIVDNTAIVDTVEFIDQSITQDFKRPEPVGPPKVPKTPPVTKEKEEKAPDIPFRVVEQMPRFPGCEDIAGTKEDKKLCADGKLLQFIQSKIKYPAIARENGIEGRCFVSFIVEKDGTVTNIELVRDIGGQCGEESIRVVNLMANSDLKWTPGKQRGVPVRVQFNLPVHFKLQ